MMKMGRALWNWPSFLLGGVCVGVVVFALCVMYLPPEIERVEVRVPVETLKVVRVEVVRETQIVVTHVQEVPVDRVVYQNIVTKRWDSIEQFTDWYWKQGFTALGGVGCRPATCVDYAVWVAEKALAQGYPVSCQMTDFNGYIAGYKVSGAWHMGCMVIAGDDLYWVGPNPEEFKFIRIGKAY